MVYGCAEYFHLKKIYLNHYRSQRPGAKGKRSTARRKKSRPGDTIQAVGSAIPHVGINAGAQILGAVVNALDGSEGDAGDWAEEEAEDDIPPEEEHGINVMAETRAFYHCMFSLSFV